MAKLNQEDKNALQNTDNKNNNMNTTNKKESQELKPRGLEDRVEIVIATKQSQTDSMVEDPTFFRKTKELWVICKHCKSPLNNYSPLKELPLDVDGIERNVGEHYQTSKGCREIIVIKK